MQARRHQGSKHIYISVVLHVIIVAAMILSYSFDSRMPVLKNADKNEPVINAMVVESAPVPTPVKVTPTPPVPPQPIMPPKPVPPAKPIIQKAAEPVVKKIAIAIPDKKQKKLQQQKLEQQLLDDLKKETQPKKKIKHEDITKSFEKEMKEIAAKSLQQQMLQEKQRIHGAHTAAVQGEVDKFKALILQAISQHWLVPGNVNKALSAELLIRLAPGGLVLDVELMKSSGDAALDRSARAAVFKASPLPVPIDNDAFNSFRQFVLKVKPENILGSDSWIN